MVSSNISTIKNINASYVVIFTHLVVNTYYVIIHKRHGTDYNFGDDSLLSVQYSSYV